MTRILCIDDNEASRYVFSRVLRAAGYDVVEGGTAADALRLVRDERPDLLLCDVNLPDGNGRDVCLHIRQDPEFAHTPVVLTSASSIADGDRIRGLNCGADAYITEPTASEELAAVINSLLRMSRAERTVAALNQQLQRRVSELETLIETVPVGIGLSRDPRVEKIIINPPLAKALAIEPGEMSAASLLGDGVATRIIEDGKRLPLERLPMQVAAATQSIIRQRELEVCRPDGSVVHLLGSAAPLAGDDGSVSGVVGVFVDVTELRRQENWRRMLAEASMLLADTLVLDRTLERITDIAVRYVADWAVIDLVRDGRLERQCVTHRDPQKRWAADAARARYRPDEDRSAPLYRAIETRQPQLVTDTGDLTGGLDPDAHELLTNLGFRSFVSAPLIARGRVIGVLSVVSATGTYDEHDVNAAMSLAERAAFAVENATLFEAASTASRAKDDFLALVSHELRTPLTAISGWIELLQRDPDAEMLKQGFGELTKSTASLRRLVEDLLDISRINSGKLRVDSRPVDLAAIAHDACDNARSAAAAKSIAVRLTADHALYILGDAVRVQQIASNLLNNAVKFTDFGGTVDVAVIPQRDSVALRVADTGRGIAREFLSRVFERFVQADPTSSTGLGLGLALVKQLTELHGGSVSVESEGIGKGSTFTVTFPRIAGPVV